MGYQHIPNLYRPEGQEVLLFRECYVLEKIHGTSAHVSWDDRKLGFFAGGESHDRFMACFDAEALAAAFTRLGHPKITVYGEAYGGKCQGMSATYGKTLKFIAFDICCGDTWLSVPDMDQVATGLGLEVVAWQRVSTDLQVLDACRDSKSEQARRNGCGEDKHREGIVIRPPIEVVKNNGARIMAKHKGLEFSERATPQRVVDPAKLLVLQGADAIATEWVTPTRLQHVLDKLPQGRGIESMREIIAAMVEDIYREARGEIVESAAARSAIGARTSKLFRQYLQHQLGPAAT